MNEKKVDIAKAAKALQEYILNSTYIIFWKAQADHFLDVEILKTLIIIIPSLILGTAPYNKTYIG